MLTPTACAALEKWTLRTLYGKRESLTCLSTRGGGVGHMIWRLMLGRLLLLLMLSISSSASVVVLLHSQCGGGDTVQSQAAELAGGLVGLELLKAL